MDIQSSTGTSCKHGAVEDINVTNHLTGHDFCTVVKFEVDTGTNQVVAKEWSWNWWICDRIRRSVDIDYKLERFSGRKACEIDSQDLIIGAQIFCRDDGASATINDRERFPVCSWVKDKDQ